MKENHLIPKTKLGVEMYRVTRPPTPFLRYLPGIIGDT